MLSQFTNPTLSKKGPGIDPELQYNKAHNIDIASRTMDKIIMEPGEEFSFWSSCRQDQ